MSKPIDSWFDLLQVAHPASKAKGWWPEHKNRPVQEQLACFHSEISEAFEEFRAGQMETWFSLNGTKVANDHIYFQGTLAYTVVDGVQVAVKPEGFWTEISDLIIRLADSAGKYGWSPKAYMPEVGQAVTIPQLICALHACVCGMAAWDDEWHRKDIVEEKLGAILTHVSIYPHAPNLWPLVELKFTYNHTRPFRHGNRQA